MLGVYIDITERKQAEDHKSLSIAELDHRVKNILACVAVIAQHTHDATESMDDFLKLLNGRLYSLANTHSLLSRNRWHGVSLTELVRGELAPWMQDGNTLIDGPNIVLTAEATNPCRWFCTSSLRMPQSTVPFPMGTAEFRYAGENSPMVTGEVSWSWNGRTSGLSGQFPRIWHLRDPRSHPL
jgi:hypothetical protein